MKKGIIAIVIVVIVVVGYFVITQDSATKDLGDSNTEEVSTGTTQEVSENETGSQEMTDNTSETNGDSEVNDPVVEDDPEESQDIIVTFDGQSYSPNVLNVKVGDTVTWVNESTKKTWPASDVHPTHTVYPTTGGCLGSTLDACKGLEEGESYSFTFEEVGAWKMHDHRAPSITMTVVVTQ